MIYKCLVADDEPIARKIIEKYIADSPDLQLSVSCKNAFEVMQELEQKQIDIVFLDINMPKLTGISLLKSIRSYPDIIITTAYSEYALEGYELEVTDYLLKPISFERFLKAVAKVRKKRSTSANENPAVIPQIDDHIFVKSDKKRIRLLYNDIYYVAAFGNYIKIYTDEMILSPSTLTDFITKLPEEQFMKIHKSYVVNTKHIKQLEGNQITLSNNEALPIGKSFRKTIADWIGK